MQKQNFLTKLFRKYLKTATKTRCLKFIEKVSFNIASEASYQKVIKMPKISNCKPDACGQTVLPDKLVENAKIHMRQFE